MIPVYSPILRPTLRIIKAHIRFFVTGFKQKSTQCITQYIRLIGLLQDRVFLPMPVERNAKYNQSNAHGGLPRPFDGCGSQ